MKEGEMLGMGGLGLQRGVGGEGGGVGDEEDELKGVGVGEDGGGEDGGLKVVYEVWGVGEDFGRVMGGEVGGREGVG